MLFIPVNTLFKTRRQRSHVRLISNTPHLVLVEVGVVGTDLKWGDDRIRSLRWWVDRIY